MILGLILSMRRAPPLEMLRTPSTLKAELEMVRVEAPTITSPFTVKLGRLILIAMK